MAKETKEFDMNKKIKKPNWFWVFIIWCASLYFNVINRVKYTKTNFKSFKEPALILCNHASMQDMASVISAIWPFRCSWVASIEEFNGREYIFRNLGIIPKRKFTTDLVMIKRIVDMIRKNKMSVTMYPETRFSLAGINEDISPAIAKLAKMAKCRVIVIRQKGNFIKSPQWNKHPYRENRVFVESTEVITAKEACELSTEEIFDRISKAFIYDDYKWQNDNHIKTPCKKRAQNIQKILYKCPVCHSEHDMDSAGTKVWCNHCHTTWEMDEYAELHQENGNSLFKLPSDWYRWEKQECINEVNEGKYRFEDDVRIEKLVNAKVGFKHIGTVHMIHDEEGFHFDGTLDNGDHFTLEKPILSMRSVHIEYDYKNRGDALDMATLEETWFVYPVHKCSLTKFNFSQEALYDKAFKKQQEEIKK